MTLDTSELLLDVFCLAGIVTGFGLGVWGDEDEVDDVVWLSIWATAEAADESSWRRPLPTPPSTSMGDPEDLMASSELPGLTSPLFRLP